MKILNSLLMILLTLLFITLFFYVAVPSTENGSVIKDLSQQIVNNNQIYDYLLIGGILLSLILLYIELQILFRTSKILGNRLKFMAIFGILFFLTALICGSAITGYVTKETMDTGITSASKKLEENNYNVATLKEILSELKKSINNLGSLESLEDKNQLINQIAYLEKKLNDLLNDNEALEDDLEDLKDQIKDFYTFVPGGHY